MTDGIKGTRPVYDFSMSVGYGLGLGVADALFGMRVADRLAWPPAQVDEEKTVERFPFSTTAEVATVFEALNKGLGGSAAFGHNHAQILTRSRAVLVDQKKLFGGDNAAGGVHGIMAWQNGAPDQVPADFVDEKCGFAPGEGPGHRGYSSAFFVGARSLKPVFNSVGDIIGSLGRIVARANRGFLWSSNDPRQPDAQFRVMRIPRAKPLSDWVASQPFYRSTEHELLAISGPFDEPRRDDNDDLLTPGGGFPRANPIAFLYEIISTRAYDMEVPDDAGIDAMSFIQAAWIVGKEKLGISIYETAGDGFADLATDILNHVGGAVFRHPVTGLYTVRLLRPDSAYTAARIPSSERPEITNFVMTPANTIGFVGEIRSRVASELISTMEVSYTIDETEEQSTVTLMSHLAASISGAGNSDERDYRLFRDQNAAITAGKRELRAAATPATTMDVEFNREAWRLAPLDRISVDWPTEPSIHGKKFRVAKIDYGTNTDRVIKASLIEDIFAADKSVYDQVATIEQRSLTRAPGSSTPVVDGVYITPATTPLLIGGGMTLDQVNEMNDQGMVKNAYMIHASKPLTGANTMVWHVGRNPPEDGVRVVSTPRALMREALGAGEEFSTFNFWDLNFGYQELDPEIGDLLVFVRTVQQDPSSSSHWDAIAPASVLVTTTQARYVQNASVRTAPWAIGSAALALDPESDTRGSASGLAPYYREEIAQITDIDYDTGVVTVKRGLFDTVPVTVPSGSQVFHLVARQEVPSPGNEIEGVNHRASFLPSSATEVAKARYVADNHTTRSRVGHPARPGNTTISFGEDVAGIGEKLKMDGVGDVVVRWASRNLTIDDADPATWLQGNITPESGTRYYVRLWRRIRSKSPISARYPSPANLVKGWYNLTGNSFVIPASDILNDMSDSTAMNAASGSWKAPTDIVAGASYAIEIGSHLGAATESEGAPGSVQNAILLLDVGLKAGGYGIDYGNDYGGAGPA